MNTRKLLAPALLAAMSFPLGAQTVTRRATITGGRGAGNCTIQVNVDHAAEVELRGDTTHLTTVGGQPAFWRDFRCNGPVPDTPSDFQIARVNGRGRVTLLKEPRRNRGSALIHIIDPQGGRGTYAIDVTWRAGDQGWGPNHPQFPAPGGGGNSVRAAVRSCQEAVIDRLNHNGIEYVTFGRTIPDNSSGPNIWIQGSANGKRRGEPRRFSFSCSVDSWSGRVRSVDVSPR